MIILKKNLIKEKQQEKHTKTEQKILKSNDNPFIVKLSFSFQDKEFIYCDRIYISRRIIFSFT